MKTLYILLFSIFLTCITGCKPASRNTTDYVKENISQNIAEFQQVIDSQLLLLAVSGNNTDSLQRSFLACRLVYKKMEYLAEYFMPTTVKLINGPPLPEIEVEENRIFEPAGLQVIEEFLFPEFDSNQRKELIKEVKKLKSITNGMKRFWENNQFLESHLFDAMRLQVFRIISLGISGFDAPLSKNSMAETAVSLKAMQEVIRNFARQYPQSKQWNILDQTFSRAITYLQLNMEFDSFDRMTFITEFGNPLSVQLLQYQKELNIPFVRDFRALRADVNTFFDENAFDPIYFSDNSVDTLTVEKVKLGERLFYDPILSSNNKRSCATCHQPDKAFTDGLVKSENIHKTGTVNRNTPTLLNAALQKGQFYDFRKTSLESQSLDVIGNKDELHGNIEEAVAKLQASPEYMLLFQKAFPKYNKINSFQVQNALASYERTLLSFDSRFDKYMRGDRTKLSVEEIKGFNLFMGKAKCGACHFMPLFNGTVPPNFTRTESEVLGVPKAAGSMEIDKDLGRFAVNPLEPWKYAFKTTTLRNIELTAPYMHNGIYTTLDEVVDFYNKGGGVGMGMNLPNQTLPFDKLNLTETESNDLVAFLKTLTDVKFSKKN
jgi:cytochrome c peroxidase